MTEEDKVLEINLFLKTALNSAGGRLFLDDLLSRCNAFTHGYQDSPQDMAFLAGKRDVGLWVWSSLLEAEGRKAYNLFMNVKEIENER